MFEKTPNRWKQEETAVRQSIHHFRSVNSAGCDGEILKRHQLSPSLTVLAAVFEVRSSVDLKLIALKHKGAVHP